MTKTFAKLGLRAKAAVVVLIVVMISLVITATTTVIQTNRLVAMGERNQVSAMARSLAEACELPLAVGDKAELLRLMHGFLSNEHTLFIAIYDASGLLVTSAARDEEAWGAYRQSREESEGFFIGQKIVELSANKTEFSVLGEGSSSGGSTHRPPRPQAGSGLFQVIGRVVVARSTAAMHAAQSSQMCITLIMVLLAAAVSLGIIFWGSKDWVRRLNALVTASERIGRGDFSQIIQDDSKDEIGTLSRTYERMREAVRDRTGKLIEANKQLRQAQADLVQSEKMGMLGQLAAGVAHEINTPAGAILNVAADANEHLQQLVMLEMKAAELNEETRSWLAEKLQQVLAERATASEASARAKRRQLERQLRGAGLPAYRRVAGVLVSCGLDAEAGADRVLRHLSDNTVLSLLEHLVALKVSAEVSLASAKKIARIVRALRFYARTTPEELAEMDVNESIDNTLVILQNRVKRLARVKTSFADALPAVRCGPDISQVWTNLLNNACEAIEDAHKDGMGLIEVSTRVDGDRVIVQISDDGPPIPEEVMRKMYDPFFTTKPLGKGTGLGLSICTGIVQRAGGTITARNETDRVTFEVALPVAYALRGKTPTELRERDAQVVWASARAEGE